MCSRSAPATVPSAWWRSSTRCPRRPPARRSRARNTSSIRASVRHRSACGTREPVISPVRTPSCCAHRVENRWSKPPSPRSRSPTRVSAWRRSVGSVVLVVVAITLLLLIGPSLDTRAGARDARTYLTANLLAILLLLSAAGVIYLAMRLAQLDRSGTHGALLLFGATAAALVALLASPTARLRIGWRGRRRVPLDRPLRFALEQLLAGLIVAALIPLFDRVLRAVLDDASVDLRHFSLHPWSAERLTLLGGILACHLAALWGATLVFATGLARWRLRRAWHVERVIALLLLGRASAGHRCRRCFTGVADPRLGRDRFHRVSAPRQVSSPSAPSRGSDMPPSPGGSWHCSSRFYFRRCSCTHP